MPRNTKLKHISSKKEIDIKTMRLVSPDTMFAYLLQHRETAVYHRDLLLNPWQKLLPARQCKKMIKIHNRRIACIDFLLKSYGYEIL